MPRVKCEFTKDPVLCNFDLNTRHLVLADTRKDAIGAVLLQFRGSKTLLATSQYASMKMTDTEK